MNHTTQNTAADTTATFSTDVTGLEDATRPEVVELENGMAYELRIAAVAKSEARPVTYGTEPPGLCVSSRTTTSAGVSARAEPAVGEPRFSLRSAASQATFSS